MFARVSTPPSSSESTRVNSRTRQQQQQQQQQQEQSQPQSRGQPYQQQNIIQQHQPFPSSTSSFSIRHSTYSSSSLLGPNESTRISFLNQGTSAGSNLNNGTGSSSNFNFPPPHQSSSSYLDGRPASKNYSLVDPVTSSSYAYGSGTQHSATFHGTARAGRGSSGFFKPRAATVHEPLLVHGGRGSGGESGSEINSLYTVDYTSPTAIAEHAFDDSEDGSAGLSSYFGSAGQDYLLKQKRAKRSKLICWVDLIALVVFTLSSGLQSSEGQWTWVWERIPWALTVMAVARILVMAFTARYSDGNYNATVIFVCVLITLLIMFEVNMIIQHRIELTAVLILQYSVSALLTQLHWISYSAHTPMSATLAYAYDPSLGEGISFSRESRYIGAFPHSNSHPRSSTMRRGTSYGTMTGLPFGAVQEMDEEQVAEDEEDPDIFIKVNVDRKGGASGPGGLVRGRNGSRGDGTGNEGEEDNGDHNHEDEVEEEDEEDQDMATLLAFQDARRQQVYAFSPTASSSVMPTRSILSSPQALPKDSGMINRTPVSWAHQRRLGGVGGSSFASSSYDMRMAAAGASGASALAAGGLTVGYTPRKRSLRSNMDPNGTGRRTWTGGHSIIYSGIFVDDSDEDDTEVDGETGHEQGLDDESVLLSDDDNYGHDNAGRDGDDVREFDDRIKAEVDSTKVTSDEQSGQNDQGAEAVPGGTVTLADPCHQGSSAHIDDIAERSADEQMETQQHTHFQEPLVDGETQDVATDAPGESSGQIVAEGHQHHPHVLSTLKFHVSSHKDVTAVMCDEDDCSEHQFQEGPAAELEAVLGPDFHGGNIVELDIKESSTSAVDLTGEGINPEFDDEVSSTGGTIRDDLFRPRLRQSNGTQAVKVEVPTTITGGANRIDGIDAKVNLPGARLGSVITVNEEPDGESGHRRIHIHERVERITVEEDDIEIDGTDIREGRPGPSGGAVGIIIGDDSTKGTTIIPTTGGPMLGDIPGQWVQIQDTDRPTGVITWGIVDDFPQSMVQEGVYVERGPSEPIVVIPPQRTAIIDPPRPKTIAIAPPALAPIIRMDPPPRRIVIPAPKPVFEQPDPIPAHAPIVFQPQPKPRVVMRPPPPPLVYSPPPRPVLLPPPPPPSHSIIMQPNPIIMQPNPIVITEPPLPQTFIQQPGSQLIMPQPQIVAPVPEYGTYETIVPGVPQARISAYPAGVGAMPLNHGYDVASIYDDRSVVSIYGDDMHSVASIYDDRSIISMNEFEDHVQLNVVPMGIGAEAGVGLGVGAGVGLVAARQAWMRTGQPLPGIVYGKQHPVSAGYMPRRQAPRGEDMEVDQDSRAYMQGSARAFGPGRLSPPRPYYDGSEYSDRTTAVNSRYDMDVDQEIDSNALALAVSRHTAFPSDSVNTEASYQEVQLNEGLPVVAPLQELAIETYFDTTKSQLKFREKQGQLLTEVAHQLKKRQQQQQQEQLEQMVQHAQEQQEDKEKQQQEPPYLPSPSMSSRATPATAVVPVFTGSPLSSLSRSIQKQQHQLQSPPSFNIPKPPQSPPPVRLLVNRGVAGSTFAQQARGAARTPSQQNRAVYVQASGDESSVETVILSTSAQNVENIMLEARHQKQASGEILVVHGDMSRGSIKARSLISESVLTPSTVAVSAYPIGNMIKPPPPATITTAAMKAKAEQGTAATRKPKKRQHIPAMSRNQLHSTLLGEGIMACWNNEFGSALEIFKDHASTYPRWSLAAAEVHIVRQLISGQLSEADSELMDALQLSEKVASRVLDRKVEFDASFIGYRMICSGDATLMTQNDNTLRQNYRWDCEMAFYDTLLYRGILQLTSASETKGTFSDIKGGLQLRRAWKGYMRIKQEMELVKEKWQKLSNLVQVKAEQDLKTQTIGEEEEARPTAGVNSGHITKNVRPARLTKTATMPISIPTTANSHAASSSNSKKGAPLSTSQPSEGSKWSMFGRRSSWNHSASSLSSSPPTEGSAFLYGSERSGSRILGTSPSAAKGLASVLRDQTKAMEEIKTAPRVLDDVEDYLHYGIGLFYFIVSIVPKSLLPALRTIGLQSNHEQGIKNLEMVYTRKNGRAPFAALFLLINYLFLPRGMSDPSISLGRAGEIVEECLKTSPNGSSYLLMACHHARKTGNMIPAALNHITRGIQTCEAAGIPSINYRFELGLTFFINQEFGKAADIFEILWRRFITAVPIGDALATSTVGGGGPGRRRKGRSQSMSQPSRSETASLGAAVGSAPGPGAAFGQEEEEEDEFELAPFCGLCLIASKAVVRLGQEGYFGYGRDGFGHHSNDNAGSGAMMSPTSGLLLDSAGSGSTTPLNFPRPGPDFDLLVAAQEVLVMMSGLEQQQATMTSTRSASGGSIFEHSKAGSAQSTDTSTGNSSITSQFLSSPAPAQAGKLNRFNKFAWNQCQKSLQRGRIAPFLPLVILYLRRDLAYMKPVLLRKYRTLLETIWKSVQQTADADTQAIYLLLNAVVHRHLLPDDATFAYTALTDCLLLESIIESEMWVVPHCHYELGELLHKKLHLPQAALEQFQWIVKGPGKETRPTSIFYAAVSSVTPSNPRLSVFGGGYPSDTVTNIVESAAAQAATHSNQASSSSNHRLSQLFPSSAAGGGSTIRGSSPTHIPSTVSNPPHPMTFYNSRYKKFEFSQALRHRSSVCLEQIQKEIDSGAGSGSTPGSRRTSVSATNEQRPQDGQADASRKRNSAQSTETPEEGKAESKSVRLSTEPLSSTLASTSNTLTANDLGTTSGGQTSTATRSSSEGQGWGNNMLPNILSDAQRKRGSQQWGLNRFPLRSSQSTSGVK